MFQQLDVTGWNVDQRVRVLAARFKQDHLRVGVFRQPVGEHAAGRTSPHDDIIRLHGDLPSPSTGF